MNRVMPFPVDPSSVVPAANVRSIGKRGTRCCVLSIGALDAASEKFESEKVSCVEAVTSDGAAISVGAAGGWAATGAGAAINDAAATAAENCGVTRSRGCVMRRNFGRSGS
jgi:hypothetical protein